MTPSHDEFTWTWTAPSGEIFRGPPDYIDGCRAGWEARSWTPEGSMYIRGFERGEEHARKQAKRCKFASTCEFSHDVHDTTTQSEGEVW